MTSYEHADLWESYMESVKAACKKDDYASAQKILRSALADAEDFGEIDVRLVNCLYSVAGHYSSLGQDDQAKELYLLLLELKEKLLGAKHPDLGDCLEKIALAQLGEQAKTFPLTQMAADLVRSALARFNSGRRTQEELAS